jgi:hypothetical protein
MHPAMSFPRRREPRDVPLALFNALHLFLRGAYLAPSVHLWIPAFAGMTVLRFNRNIWLVKIWYKYPAQSRPPPAPC